MTSSRQWGHEMFAFFIANIKLLNINIIKS